MTEVDYYKEYIEYMDPTTDVGVKEIDKTRKILVRQYARHG